MLDEEFVHHILVVLVNTGMGAVCHGVERRFQARLGPKKANRALGVFELSGERRFAAGANLDRSAEVALLSRGDESVNGSVLVILPPKRCR